MTRHRSTFRGDEGPRDGFTMIELVAVLAIMAMLVGAVVWVGRGYLSTMDAQGVITRVTLLDDMARHRAIRSGRPGELVFDLSDQTMWWSAQENDLGSHDKNDERSKMRIPGHVELRQILLSGRHATSGQVRIPYSTLGHCPTYALWIRHPHDDGPGQWLFVAGITGQKRVIDNEKPPKQLLAYLAG